MRGSKRPLDQWGFRRVVIVHYYDDGLFEDVKDSTIGKSASGTNSELHLVAYSQPTWLLIDINYIGGVIFTRNETDFFS